MTRRVRRTRTCDAPGCTVEVTRGILMCRPHWFALPRPLRQAINAAWKERRIHEWSANCLEARSFLARSAEPAPAVSAQRSYQLQAAMLGERPE
ncbi:hypothetical protein [Sphingomonas aracearum]|uniref:Uncharacterized protein n=1 Tax=Sphingomonas aracearum TaxID=2283317 RepID=A0A369VQI9_9SPHN|nr:hypothetical protein [Sphingomonas aracearum]RDE04666.1 hypothetical protein DVW87_13825 [Sphingomonas aracearum]